MPQASNLVLKNGATTPVDKTFTLLAPAAGYGSIAEWALREGGTPNMYPRITALVRAGMSPGSGSKLPTKVIQCKFRLPYGYTDVNGVAVTTGAAEANLSFTLPDDFPDSLSADFVAFSKNFMATTVLADMLAQRAPAT